MVFKSRVMNSPVKYGVLMFPTYELSALLEFDIIIKTFYFKKELKITLWMDLLARMV